MRYSINEMISCKVQTVTTAVWDTASSYVGGRLYCWTVLYFAKSSYDGGGSSMWTELLEWTAQKSNQ